MLQRRTMLSGLLSTPFIIKYSSLMPVKHFELIKHIKGNFKYDIGMFYCPYIPLQQINLVRDYKNVSV